MKVAAYASFYRTYEELKPKSALKMGSDLVEVFIVPMRN